MEDKKKRDFIESKEDIKFKDNNNAKISENVDNVQKSAKKKKVKISQDILAELYSLRSNLSSIIEHTTIKLNSQITKLISLFENENIPMTKSKLPSAKNINMMVKKIKNIKLKPKKGRIKDIERISKLLEYLKTKIPPEI